MSSKETYLDNSIRQLLAYKRVEKIIISGNVVDTETLIKVAEQLKVDIADPLWGAYKSGDHKIANMLCGPTLSLIEEKIGSSENKEERRVRKTQLEFFKNFLRG